MLIDKDAKSPKMFHEMYPWKQESGMALTRPISVILTERLKYSTIPTRTYWSPSASKRRREAQDTSAVGANNARRTNCV